MTARNCATCHHACSPLPADWTALAFFDRPVAAQEAVFRTTCTAVPDADKPCLKPAAAAGELAHMDKNRLHLVLETAWEIDALARALPGLVPNIDEAEGAHLVVRALAGRMLRLSHVLMGAADPAGETTEELAQVFTLNGGQG